jgi:hypothetical protein
MEERGEEMKMHEYGLAFLVFDIPMDALWGCMEFTVVLVFSFLHFKSSLHGWVGEGRDCICSGREVEDGQH